MNFLHWMWYELGNHTTQKPNKKVGIPILTF